MNAAEGGPMIFALFVLVVGIYLLAAATDRAEEAAVPVADWVFAGCVAGGGLLVFLAWLALGLLRPNTLGNLVLRRRLLDAISRRGDPLVSPGDAGARVSEIVPQENRGRLKLDDAEDVGLIRVDARTGDLLFEGDLTRRRVPAAAVREVTYVPLTQTTSQHTSTTHHQCVVAVETPQGLRRWPFVLREPLAGDAARRAFGLELIAGLSRASSLVGESRSPLVSAAGAGS